MLNLWRKKFDGDCTYFICIKKSHQSVSLMKKSTLSKWVTAIQSSSVIAFKDNLLKAHNLSKYTKRSSWSLFSMHHIFFLFGRGEVSHHDKDYACSSSIFLLQLSNFIFQFANQFFQSSTNCLKFGCAFSVVNWSTIFFNVALHGSNCSIPGPNLNHSVK